MITYAIKGMTGKYADKYFIGWKGWMDELVFDNDILRARFATKDTCKKLIKKWSAVKGLGIVEIEIKEVQK